MQDHVIFCETPADVAEAAAELIFEKQTEAVADRGVFRIALSGGKTPKALYKLLASEPYSDELSWEHWEVYWSDERAVPHDHLESNYRLAHTSLLSKVPVGKVFRMEADGADLHQAASNYANLLEQRFQQSPPVFDVILLGIGSDGHTASIFPSEVSPVPPSSLVAAVDVRSQPIPHRLTLTYRTLNAARTVIFLISGEDKAPAVQRILEHGDPALPATHVKPESGDCYWLLDDAAAHLLE